ncbi:MAG: acetyltransferase [Ruminococcaceae bacterium]|nr:acetyltransferase [Oscillospiraceae bacterium]
MSIFKNFVKFTTTFYKGVAKKLIKKILYNFIVRRRTKALTSCGSNVRINKNCNFQGNIECGNNIHIGSGAYFVSTKAKLIIKDNVMFAPNVTIYTGDHPVNVIGKHIIEITDIDKEKMGGVFDKDVIIEEGCWIGTRAIILKGVTIGRGSVIGAGAVVTKDVPPYSIYVGVPAARTFARFTEEEIKEHERILAERGLSPNSQSADFHR